MFIVIFLLVLAFGLTYPKVFILTLAAPIVGTVFGGFVWGIAASVNPPMFTSWDMFTYFVIGGTALTAFFFLTGD